MTLRSSIPLSLRVVAILALVGCGADSGVDCVVPPCALSLALTITVSNAATAGTVPNATFQTHGEMDAAGQCNGTPTTCRIPGGPGTYTVTIGAPGFQSATRSVTVTGAEAEKCNCAIVNTEHLDIALVAN